VIVDNGSAHRGQRSIDRLQGSWSNLILVHTPVHASWLNRAEIYFSVVQRKILTPNDFADLDTLEHSLLAFGRRYGQIATPFEWKFTRADLNRPPQPHRPANAPRGVITSEYVGELPSQRLSEEYPVPKSSTDSRIPRAASLQDGETSPRDSA
jgi:hypothetical protein